MLLLLHPTHRKFINLLKKHLADGNVIILTQEDIEEFKIMFNSTNRSLKRHQILYKIFLRAINRPVVKPCCHDVVVDDLLVKEIEKRLRRIEFKNPLGVLKYVLVMNILKFLKRTSLADFVISY